jgi:hypothetical protein
MAKATLKKTKGRGLTLKSYAATLIRTVWYWYKDRHKSGRTESSIQNQTTCI